MTRSNRRPLVTGALAASAALATGLLAACSAGQIAQTAEIQPAVPGANAQASGFPVYIRNATVDYLEPKGYPKGAKAPLSLWIFNNMHQSVTLVGVTAAQHDGGRSEPVQVVLSTGRNAASASPAPACSVPTSLSPAPLPTTTASGGAPPTQPSTVTSTGTAKSTPSGTAKSTPSTASSAPSTSPSTSPSPEPSPSAAGPIKVVVPPGGCVELSRRAAQYLQGVDLPEPLGNQDALAVTFGFRTADGQSFTIGQPLDVPVSVPASPPPRPAASRAE